MVDFFIESLLLTNIWVFLYTNVVPLLNFHFPAAVKGLYYRPAGIFPEPYEMLIYILLSLFFAVLIWFLNKAVLEILDKLSGLKIKPFLLIFLVILFLSKLGSFPLGSTTNPSQTEFFIWLIYVSALIVFCLQSYFLRRLLKGKKHLELFSYILVALFVVLTTFPAKFPISGINYAHFFGPVWEVVQGKTIFTHVPSRYGFLSILSLALFSKIGLLNILNLPVMIWGFYIIEYLLFFYLIHKTGKSFLLAAIAISSLITLDYYSYIPSPQSGPMRWLPIIFAIFLFYKIKKIDSGILIFILSLLSLWMIDSGQVIIFGYLITLLFFGVKKLLSPVRIIKSAFLLFLSLGSILLTINFIHIFLGMNPINFLGLFHDLRTFAVSGNSMIPIPPRTYFWLFMLVYFASVIYFFRVKKAHIEQNAITVSISKAKNADSQHHGPRGKAVSYPVAILNWLHVQEDAFKPSTVEIGTSILLFSANLMLFASIYYVGRSADDYLFKLAIFPLLTFFLILGSFYRNLTNRMKLIITFFIFVLLIAWPSIMRKEYLSQAILQNYAGLSDRAFFKPEIHRILQKKYSQEANLINKNIKDSRIVIISQDDTYLFLLTGKKNLLNVNPQNDLIISKSDMKSALKNLEPNCPHLIAVDCRLAGRCQKNQTLLEGWFPFETAIFDEIESKCRAKYLPTVCTSQICIVKKNII